MLTLLLRAAPSTDLLCLTLTPDPLKLLDSFGNKWVRKSLLRCQSVFDLPLDAFLKWEKMCSYRRQHAYINEINEITIRAVHECSEGLRVGVADFAS